MKQHYLSKGFNFIIISLALLMLVYSYLQLFHQRYNSSFNSELPLIGEIVGHDNTVKLKKAHLFSWLDVQNTQKINAEDLIFTYKKSSSVVMLGQDKTIKIYPETMIQLESADKLDIKKGTAEFEFKKKNSKLTIYLGNQKVTLNSDNAKVIIEKGQGKGRIKVTSGKLQVNTNNKSYDVTSSEQLSITQEKVQVTAVDLNPISPNNEIIKMTSQRTEIPFTFEASKGTTTDITIAQDSNFTKVITRKEVSTSPFATSLHPGKYFWKLSQADQVSETASFSIIHLAMPPKDLIPVAEFELQTFDESTEVKFDWNSADHNQNFHIEIFNSDQKLILSEVVEQRPFNWKTKLNGDFTWHIRAVGNYTEGQWSPKQQFSIMKKNYDEKESMIIELKRPNQKVTFNWERPSGNPSNTKASVFTLSRDKNFISVIREIKVKSNSTSVVFPTTGKFYWKINSYNSQQKVRPKTIIIRPTPPPKKPSRLPNLKLKIRSKKQTYFNPFSWIISNAYAGEGYVDLGWPKVEDAKVYEIEIYTDKELKNKILQAPSSDNTHRWEVPRAGKYYWRFRFKDYWGRYSPFSDASELLVTPTMAAKQTAKPKSKTPLSNPVVSKQITTTKIPKKSYPYWFSYAIIPANVDYTQATDDSYKIQGTALGGYALAIGTNSNNKHSADLEYKVFAGKVFNGQDYLSRQIDLSYNYRVTPFFVIDTGVIINQMSSYKTVSAEAAFDEMITSYGTKIGGFYQIKQIPLQLGLNYCAGPFSGISFYTKYLHSFWKRYQWGLQLDYTSNSVTSKEDTEITLSSSNVNFILKYFF